MVLESVGVLAIHSPRTRTYLQAMIERRLLPSGVVLLHDAQRGLLPGQISNDPSSLVAMATKAGIPIQLVPTADVNDPRVVAAIASRPEPIFLYSGSGGAILRHELLGCGKRFLHIHPGLVPLYRGSTPIYYSILNEGSCGASALFLAERIDVGPVIRTKRYPLPQDGSSIDYQYDPAIRADLLVDVLETYASTGELRAAEQPAEGETYYIVHPVLKHLAILACETARTPIGAGHGGER